MLSYIKGILAERSTDGIVVEASGIGYEISCSSNALAIFGSVGDSVQVWTYLQLRDDGLSLFGFASKEEKELFCRLISVTGIGAKIALAALSAYKATQLAHAIATGDIDLIATIPGIGKKTAQRLVLELQGIMQSEQAADAVPGSASAAFSQTSSARSAAAALSSMGFTAQEITLSMQKALEQLVGTKAIDDASTLVSTALRQMGGPR